MGGHLFLFIEGQAIANGDSRRGNKPSEDRGLNGLDGDELGITSRFRNRLDSKEDGENNGRGGDDFDRGPNPGVGIGDGVFDVPFPQGAADCEEDDRGAKPTESVRGLIDPRERDVEAPESDIFIRRIRGKPIRAHHGRSGDGLQNPEKETGESRDENRVEEDFLQNRLQGHARGVRGNLTLRVLSAFLERDARDNHIGVAIKEDAVSDVHDVEIVACGLAIDRGDERIGKERRRAESEEHGKDVSLLLVFDPKEDELPEEDEEDVENEPSNEVDDCADAFSHREFFHERTERKARQANGHDKLRENLPGLCGQKLFLSEEEA